MKLKLKETPEQIELIKAMASSNKMTAMEAQQAFAAFVGPVVEKVLSQLGTASLIYSDLPYNEDEPATFPLDLYFNAEVGYVTVYSQALPGGLPTSHVSGLQEMTFATYRLDSAVSMLKRYARRARLDVVSAALTRMAQEVLIKQERNAWAVLLKALGSASTGGTVHTITSTTANVLQLDDFNRLLTLIKRINQSFAAGTPSDFDSAGLTDLYMSPEMIEQVRGFVYQPMNTRAGHTGSTQSNTAVALPDSIRESIFRAAGLQEVYGKTIHELNELGTGQKYNVLFGQFATGNIAHGSTFSTANDELIIGCDASRDAFKRPIAKNAESGSTFTAVPDDQWVSRSDKLGFYGSLEEGRACLDCRAIVGLTV